MRVADFADHGRKKVFRFTVKWFQDKTRIEYNSPIASHLRKQSTNVRPRTRVSHSLFGLGWSTNEPQRFACFPSMLTHVQFDQPDRNGNTISGSFRMDFLTAVA
jgi:hypothetical protein